MVVGSGAGGMAAALTAAKLGATSIVLEKTPLVGGTTAYSEAMIWVPCSAQAQAAGIEDSIESALEYIAAAAGNQFDRERMQAYLQSAPAMLSFIEANSAVRYSLARGSIDYYPGLPGATTGARALCAGKFDGRKLGQAFKRLRTPLAATTILGGMSIAGTDLPHFYQVGRSTRSTAVVANL